MVHAQRQLQRDSLRRTYVIPSPFRYHRATSAANAATLLAETPGAVILAGGQSLVNALKLDLVAPTALIDVHRLEELRRVEEADGALVIGAAVTYAELADSAAVRLRVPMLASVCAGLVDRQVRNRGTVGGNVCLNDPTSNLPPLLAALGATFEVLIPDGVTAYSAKDFFLGTLFTAAASGVLTAIRVPVTSPTTRVFYRHQQVGADSWALARVVGAVALEQGKLADARLYLAAVPASPVRLTAVEERLVGRSANDAGVVEAALAAFDATDIEFVGDAHGSAAYRRQLARVQLKRLLADIGNEEAAA